MSNEITVTVYYDGNSSAQDRAIDKVFAKYSVKQDASGYDAGEDRRDLHYQIPDDLEDQIREDLDKLDMGLEYEFVEETDMYDSDEDDYNNNDED